MSTASQVYYRVPVARRWNEAQELLGLTLEPADEALQASHRTPGQYLKLRHQDKEGYFALASAPGAPAFELLLKLGTPLTDGVALLAPGQTVEATAAMGKGFPLEAHQGKNILLFAVGSGISPIRSALLHLLNHRKQFGELALFYGVKTPEHFAYQREFDEWEARGLKFVRTISQPDGASWQGATGYVQDVLAKSKLDLSHSVALLCGMKPMVEGVKAVLTQSGLASDHILTNF